MNELIKKAWAVINSCETYKQAESALRYLELMATQHPDLDVSPLRRELKTLFDLRHA
jgi:hypothetical protein